MILNRFLVLAAGLIAGRVAQESEAFQEFNSVCSSHQDNLWTILVAKP